MSYSSDDDLSSLAVDVEGQMARFVTKTSCRQLVIYTNVLDLGIEAHAAVTGEVSFNNRNKHCIFASWLYLVQCSYPDSDEIIHNTEYTNI